MICTQILASRSSLLFIMAILYWTQAGGWRFPMFKAKHIHHRLIVSLRLFLNLCWAVFSAVVIIKGSSDGDCRREMKSLTGFPCSQFMVMMLLCRVGWSQQVRYRFYSQLMEKLPCSEGFKWEHCQVCCSYWAQFSSWTLHGERVSNAAQT